MDLDQFVADVDVEALAAKYDDELTSELLGSDESLLIYLFSREQGSSPRFAEMCAMREAPGTKGTDRAFNDHARKRMEAMPEINRKRVLAIAQKAGINTQGKYYVGGLGRYNDPGAWVSTTDDVVATAKKKNLTVDGVVKHQGRAMPRPESIPLAADIVDQLQEAYLKDPKEREAAQKRHGITALREKIIAKHGAPKK